MLRPAPLEHEGQGRIRRQRVADDRQVEGLALERPDDRVRVVGFRHFDTRQLAQQLLPNPCAAHFFWVGEESGQRDGVHALGTGPARPTVLAGSKCAKEA